jgi:hypothetical protein
MSQTLQTFSYIIDQITHTWSMIKRPNKYYNVVCVRGGFYYHQILGAIYSHEPITIPESDLVQVEGFAELTRQEKRAAVYGAVRKFMSDNGQGDIIERLMRQNKLDVIIQ